MWSRSSSRERVPAAARTLLSFQWRPQLAYGSRDSHSLARVLVGACRGSSEHVEEIGRVSRRDRGNVILRVALEVSEDVGTTMSAKQALEERKGSDEVVVVMEDDA